MAKARGRGKPVRRRDKKGGPGSGRRKPCQHCRDKIEQVDYKDVTSLSKFISEKGKIRSRRITGSCRRHQSQIARAVKRARELALLPYVNEGGREDSPARCAGATATGNARDCRCPKPSFWRTSRRSASRARSIDVSKGYLRNYLVPRKLAQPATKGAIEVIRERQAGGRAGRAQCDRKGPGERQPAEPHCAHDPPAGRRRRTAVRVGDRPGHRHRGARSARPENRQTGRAPARADQERRHLHDRRSRSSRE